MKKALSLILSLILLLSAVPFASAESGVPTAETVSPLLLNTFNRDIPTLTGTADDMALCAASAILDVTLAGMTDASNLAMLALESDSIYMLISEDSASLQICFFTEGARLDFVYTPEKQTAIVTTSPWNYALNQAPAHAAAMIAPGSWASCTPVAQDQTAACLLALLDILSGEGEAAAE